MKRLLALMIVLGMALSLPAVGEEALYAAVDMRPGDVWTCSLALKGEWESDAPEVATVENGVITAHDPGFATITVTAANGSYGLCDVTVSEDAMPALIRAAVDLALQEWQDNLGKTFTQRNKYTAWYCGTGPNCYFGWCGGFVSYCLDTAGVPMDDYNSAVPHDNLPYAIRAAGVGKLITGYTKMGRITKVPQAGYLVVYGQRNRSTTIHVGMITEVIDRGGGIYELRTVEGNVSNRIKRYNYLYDTTNTNEHNMRVLPADEQTDTATYQYTLHQDDWFVANLCQTWY